MFLKKPTNQTPTEFAQHNLGHQDYNEQKQLTNNFAFFQCLIFCLPYLQSQGGNRILRHFSA